MFKFTRALIKSFCKKEDSNRTFAIVCHRGNPMTTPTFLFMNNMKCNSWLAKEGMFLTSDMFLHFVTSTLFGKLVNIWTFSSGGVLVQSKSKWGLTLKLSLFFCTNFLAKVKGYLPPGKRTSWRRRGDIFLSVPTTSQVRLKCNTQRHIGGTSPRLLIDTSPRRH